MAFSYTFDIGCEYGGGFMNNPGRYPDPPAHESRADSRGRDQVRIDESFITTALARRQAARTPAP
jgi:hypothetical protein